MNLNYQEADSLQNLQDKLSTRLLDYSAKVNIRDVTLSPETREVFSKNPNSYAQIIVAMSNDAPTDYLSDINRDTVVSFFVSCLRDLLSLGPTEDKQRQFITDIEQDLLGKGVPFHMLLDAEVEAVQNLAGLVTFV